MKKTSFFTLVFLILCFIPVSCSPYQKSSTDKNSGECFFEFTDDTGYKTVLKEKPKKIAILFSSLADIWISAGGEISMTVGESIERGFCSSDIPICDSGAGKNINCELLLSYEPDFVIGSADITSQTAAAEIIRAVGIPCALFRVDSFEDYLHVLDICCYITENPAAYTENGENIKSDIESLFSSIDELEKNTDILFIRAASSSSATKAKNASQNFVCGMLDELGVHNIADDVPILLDGLSEEEILLADPQHIFISTMGDEKAAKEYMKTLLESGIWKNLSAVKNGNIHFLPKDLFQFKPCSRWNEAYLYLYEILYSTSQ